MSRRSTATGALLHRRYSRLRVPGLQPALAYVRAGECRTPLALPRRREARASRCGDGEPSTRRPERSSSNSTRPNLSGGQQQRVAIARAIVTRPASAARRRADRQPRHRALARDHGAPHRAATASRASPSAMVTHEARHGALTRVPGRAHVRRRPRRAGRRAAGHDALMLWPHAAPRAPGRSGRQRWGARSSPCSAS